MYTDLVSVTPQEDYSVFLLIYIVLWQKV